VNMQYAVMRVNARSENGPLNLRR